MKAGIRRAERGVICRQRKPAVFICIAFYSVKLNCPNIQKRVIVRAKIMPIPLQVSWINRFCIILIDILTIIINNMLLIKSINIFHLFYYERAKNLKNCIKTTYAILLLSNTGHPRFTGLANAPLARQIDSFHLFRGL